MGRVTSASFHGGLTSQDDKFDLPSPLPSPSLKSQHARNQGWPAQVYSAVHQTKPQPKWKEIQEGQKWCIHKSCSSGEHIRKQTSKKAALVGQHCILPPSLCTMEAIQNHTKDNVWCQTVTTTDLLCTPKLLAHMTWSIVYPVLILSCLCTKTQD